MGSETANTPILEAPNHHWHEVLPSRLRWALRIEAGTWRQLSNLGFLLHRWAPPVPPTKFHTYDTNCSFSLEGWSDQS